MTGPTVRGRCPSLLMPMESGDGLLVRVKPRAATLTAIQAETLAAAADRFGNGTIEPTNRGHLQVRGLSGRTVDEFAAAMAGIGLAATGPEAEAVRNVLVDPLGLDDPAAPFDSHALARRLSAILENEAAFHELPDKFGLLVDAGVTMPLAGCTADIMVRAASEGLSVALDGGGGGLCLPECTAEDAVCRLLTAFLSWMKGPGSLAVSSAPRRMRAMVAACGTGGAFDAAGLSGVRPIESGPEPAPARPPAGFAPVPGAKRGCFAVAVPFGSMEASGLAALAELSGRFADGTIRVTPWKSLLLCGVSPDDSAAVGAAVSDFGLIAAVDDARSRIVACAGRPRCASGYADTRADAAYLAAAGLPGTGPLHLSGCGKGCAHPTVAGTTLVAGSGGYGLVRNGRAGDAPERTGLTRQAAAKILAAANSEVPERMAGEPVRIGAEWG